ncbi:MAG: hypothetical protein C3F13_04370 [Anaerolineales bacterium]|nr:MAG: hypothetical protein C3F13_04370 [Anaerolineales bacterium]
MIKKLSQLIAISLMLVSLSACATAGIPVETSLPPTQVIIATSTPLTPTETPTSSPPTPTPIPSATPLPVNAIQHYPTDQEFSITYIHMIDLTHGWAIGSLGARAGDHVLFTSDGGSTWKDVTPPESKPAADQAKAAVGFFQDLNTAWVTYFINGGYPMIDIPVVWKTTDQGLTWTASQPLDITGLSEVYVPAMIQFVAGENGWLLVHVGVGMNHDYIVIYRTTDGGTSWQRILDPYNDGGIQSCSKNAMLFTDATHGWLTGDCNGVKAGVLLFNTLDGGMTWQPVTLPDPSGAPGIYENMNMACGSYEPFFFGNDVGHLSVRCADYSAAQIQNKYYIYSTQDAGSTWTCIPYPGDALYFYSAETGWATSLILRKTTDGGQSWTVLTDVTWTPQMDFVSEQNGWAVATAGNEVALVKTDNGGLRWSIIIPSVGP